MATGSLDDDLNKLKIKNDDINILLLGETGVGKSTFINAIANYLTYSSDFETLEKKPDKLSVLIPMIVNVEDKSNKNRNIPIGKTDQNEVLKIGESATQDVKTYVFPIWDNMAKVRIIDTPGMGDTRGVKQDHINSENILSYISQLDELHAICFLFKPDNARCTVFFQYCIAQIFSRLDKSASNNIIFVFTGTRGSNYGPGDTIQVLRKTIDDIRKRPPHVQIPLGRNIFCFENESFKYLASLAAIGEKAVYSKEEKEKCKESWKKSSSEIWRLIKYIVGDHRNKPLEPHLVKNTTAVNEARRMITQLAKPLADVSELINDNINVLRRHEDNLRLDSTSLEELKKQLFMPVINLKTIEQTQPVTVCAHRSCAEIYKVGDNNKWHYKERCHDPCFLQNVPKELIGTPELVKCSAMGGTKNCKKCGCDFSVHMHIYYMTKTVEEVVKDENIEKNVTTKEKILEERKKLIQQIRCKKEEYDNEQKVIIKTCAKFAHFLEDNAITPFNDSYKEYIEYLINREKSLGNLCNLHTLKHLQRLLVEYEEAKRFFEEAKSASGKSYVTPQEISQGINDLYGLKHTGHKIKELFECQTKSRRKEYKNTEYVHAGIPKRSGMKKDKGDKKTRDSDKSEKEGRKNDKRESRSNRGRSYNNYSSGRDSGREDNRRQTTDNRKSYQQRNNRGNYQHSAGSFQRYPQDSFQQPPGSHYQNPPGTYQEYPTRPFEGMHSNANYYNTPPPLIPPLMGNKTNYEDANQYQGNTPGFDIGIQLNHASGQQYTAGNPPFDNTQPHTSHHNYYENYQQYAYDPNSPHGPPSGSYPYHGYPGGFHGSRHGDPSYPTPYNNYPPQGYPHSQHPDHPPNRDSGNRQHGNARSRPSHRNNNFRGGRGRRGGVNKNYKSENQKKKVEESSETDSDSETETSSSDSSDS